MKPILAIGLLNVVVLADGGHAPVELGLGFFAVETPDAERLFEGFSGDEIAPHAHADQLGNAQCGLEAASCGDGGADIAAGIVLAEEKFSRRNVSWIRPWIWLCHDERWRV